MNRIYSIKSGRNALVFGCALVCLSLLVACGESKPGALPPPSDAVQPTPDAQPMDVGPVTDCTDLPSGTVCDDGNPCTAGDACDGQGSCIGANSTVCPDADTNPCTNPVCDPINGDPANGYCTEVPLVSEAVEDACYTYQCADGKVTETEPSTPNDCADWAVPAGGCIDQYVCDPQYESPVDGSHCRPVGKVNGTPCLSEGVGVKAASDGATEDETSDCLLYVCHQESGPNTALTTPQCVLSSTLPDDVQQSIEDDGGKLRHVCSLEDAPDAVNTQCNDWKCGCMGDDCAQPECQAAPKNTMAMNECSNGNACDGSVCLPAKIAGATMECAPFAGAETKVCDVFPDATCDVSLPCDADIGCPNALNVEASNKNCQVNNPCIDNLNTFCAPNDPNADPETGCVTNFKDAGSACGQGLLDDCVLSATCEADGESMKCQVNETVTCNDGNPCTKDFCSDGQCQTTDLPNGSACSDDNECTQDDTCQDAQCAGTALSCDDGQDCTVDSCNPITGCAFVPNDTLCDDNEECTSNTCVPGAGCQTSPLTGPACNDDNECTANDACQNAQCKGTPLVCNDGIDCTADSCNPLTGCAFVPNDTLCSDNKACTTNTCVENVGCQTQALTGPACNDNNACTENDACQNAQCKGTTVSCNDGIDCTADSCNAISGCNFLPNDGLCVDDEECTENTCVLGVGCQASPLTGPACNDDNNCTENDACQNAQCKGTTVSCNDGIDCTADSCNPITGCAFVPNNALCGDNNQCTTNTCVAKVGCETKALTGPACIDDDNCTENDYCQNGSCASGNTKTCNDFDDCTADSCADGQCVFTPIPNCGFSCDECNDGNLCTDDVCNEAAQECTYPSNAAACDDNSLCTTDSCDPKLGCVNTSLDVGAPCYTGPANSKGVGPCTGGVTACDPKSGTFCQGEIVPGLEQCENNEDDNCDGEVDEWCTKDCEPYAIKPCYTGPAGTENTGACRTGYQQCQVNGLLWSDCYDEITPMAEDLCGNGVDDNCNGTTEDEACSSKVLTALWVDGDNGDDETGNGSFLMPYKTVTKGLTAQENPSILVLKSGENSTVYEEYLDWYGKSGIHILGWGPSRPVLAGGVRIIHCDDCTLENLEIQYPKLSPLDTPPNAALNTVHNYRNTFRNIVFSAPHGLPNGKSLAVTHFGRSALFVDVEIDNVVLKPKEADASYTLIRWSDNAPGSQILRSRLGTNISLVGVQPNMLSLRLMELGGDCSQEQSKNNNGMYAVRNALVGNLDLTSMALQSTSFRGIKISCNKVNEAPFGYFVANNTFTNISADTVTVMEFNAPQYLQFKIINTSNILGPFNATQVIGTKSNAPTEVSYSNFLSVTQKTDGKALLGPGNLSVDPLFVDPDNGDFNLQAGSQCIESGNPVLSNPDGTTSDMGAFGGPLATW